MNFFTAVVVPAFEAIDAELQKHGRDAVILSASEGASIRVTFQDKNEINYMIKVKDLYPSVVLRLTDEKDGRRYVAEEYLRSGNQDYTVSDISTDEIIHHFLSKYKQRLK